MEIELTVKTPAVPVPAPPPKEAPIYTATYRRDALVIEVESSAPYGYRQTRLHVRTPASVAAAHGPVAPVTIWLPTPYAVFEDDLALFLAAFDDAVAAREVADRG